MRVKMARFHVSTCICILLLLACHKFSFCNGDVGETQTHKSHVKENLIGPHRQKRSEQEFVNEVDDGEEDGKQKYMGHSDQDDIDEDDDEVDDDEEFDDDDDHEHDGDDQNDDQNEKAGDSQSLPTKSRLKENLNLLKNTRKSLGRYVREGSSLDKLMTESSELAKEVGAVFNQMGKRETGLEKEMESLKEALNGALVTLKNIIKKEEEKKSDDDDGSGNDGGDEEQKQTLLRQRRHFNYQKHREHPYRACVEIEPIIYDENFIESKHQQTTLKPPVKVQEYMPSRLDSQIQNLKNNLVQQNSMANNVNNREQVDYTTSLKNKAIYSSVGDKIPRPPSANYPPPAQSNPPLGNKHPPQPPQPLPMTSKSLASYQQESVSIQTKNSHSPPPRNLSDVDLSEVYWLRLDPNRKQEALRAKMDNLLKEKQNQGKDILVIPVAHSFQNTDEVKNGFLRAVRVRPNALDKKLFRKLRSLNIMELV